MSRPRYFPAKGGKSTILRYGKPTRVSTYLTKSKVYKDMEKKVWEAMDEQLTDADKQKYKALLVDNQQLSVEVEADFGFSEKGYFNRDTSNYIKSLEDAVKVKLGIDDSRHTKVFLTKHMIKTGDWVTLYHLDVIKNEEFISRNWHSEELRF